MHGPDGEQDAARDQLARSGFLDRDPGRITTWKQPEAGTLRAPHLTGDCRCEALLRG